MDSVVIGSRRILKIQSARLWGGPLSCRMKRCVWRAMALGQAVAPGPWANQDAERQPAGLTTRTLELNCGICLAGCKKKIGKWRTGQEKNYHERKKEQKVGKAVLEVSLVKFKGNTKMCTAKIVAGVPRFRSYLVLRR